MFYKHLLIWAASQKENIRKVCTEIPCVHLSPVLALRKQRWCHARVWSVQWVGQGIGIGGVRILKHRLWVAKESREVKRIKTRDQGEGSAYGSRGHSDRPMESRRMHTAGIQPLSGSGLFRTGWGNEFLMREKIRSAGQKKKLKLFKDGTVGKTHNEH